MNLIERIEGAELATAIERDIRVAVWNTCRWRGGHQDVAQSFITHLMAEPTMVSAMSAVAELAALRAIGDTHDG